MVNLKKSFADALEFINNKICFVRVDLNLPRNLGEFTDLTRLEAILPTIKHLKKRNSKIVLLSHLGRPKGKVNNELSLKPIAKLLENALEHEVLFSEAELLTTKAEKCIKNLKSGQILLLENIRFYKQEELNDENFSKSLAKCADIFINECFSSSHRKHCSTFGLAEYLPSFPGCLLEYELENLSMITKQIESISSIAVLGGSKVSSKIDIIYNLLNKFDKILIGGAMANTFLNAKKINVGKSLVELASVKEANEILKIAGDKIILPVDATVLNDETNDRSIDEIFNLDINNIRKNHIIYDIGPKTRKNYFNEISKYKKLLWNGPLGFFEKQPFDNGTNFVSSIVSKTSQKNLFSVAGGGDTISALKNSKNIDNFSFISTGGGAFLEFISGKTLPCVDILNN